MNELSVTEELKREVDGWRNAYYEVQARLDVANQTLAHVQSYVTTAPNVLQEIDTILRGSYGQ
jgi:hypothetical protein